MVVARIAVWVLTAYVTVGAYFWFAQSKLLFPAPESHASVRPNVAGFEDLRIGGVHAWWVPADEAKAKTAIVFHGNGYTIEDMVGTELDRLRATGLNLLLVEYRGYEQAVGLAGNLKTFHARAGERVFDLSGSPAPAGNP